MDGLRIQFGTKYEPLRSLVRTKKQVKMGKDYRFYLIICGWNFYIFFKFVFFVIIIRIAFKILLQSSDLACQEEFRKRDRPTQLRTGRTQVRWQWLTVQPPNMVNLDCTDRVSSLDLDLPNTKRYANVRANPKCTEYTVFAGQNIRLFAFRVCKMKYYSIRK